MRRDLHRNEGLFEIIIQHIMTMSKYGHSALNIRRVHSQVSAIYVISCVADKNDGVLNFFAIKNKLTRL